MAKIKLICKSCGKDFEVRKPCNNSSDARHYEAWAKENICECPECRAARAQSEALAGIDLSIELSGSEKQISWAKSLRIKYATACAKVIRKKDQENESALLSALNSIIAEHADARYWIDHRDDPFCDDTILAMLKLRARELEAASAHISEESAEAPNAPEIKKINVAEKCGILASCFIQALGARETSRFTERVILSSDGKPHTYFMLSFDSSNSEYSASGTIKYWWGIGGYLWKGNEPHEFSETAKLPKELSEKAHAIYREKMAALHLN